MFASLGLVTALAFAVAAPSAGASGGSSSSSCPWTDRAQPISRRVAEVIHSMTLNDEITVVEGAGNNNPYVFYMPGIPRLCIPPLSEEDGPLGVADKLTGVTQLPAGVDLAATFNPALARRYGQVVGAEEWGKGAEVDLGPTVNIDRDPRWGRSFETYTEDPFLNASLAVSEINGVQSQREMAQVKHFDAYNQETNRNLPPDNAIVSARTLHEIYMPAFEAAVKQGRASSVMCSYSAVNGSFACDNRYLLTGVLRQEWGFPGFVTSDYGALHSTRGALDGTDQEQPENTYFGARLERAVTNGSIPRAVLNTMVARILGQMFRFDLIDRPPTGNTTSAVSTAGHQALSNQVADAGAVLLRNVRGTLPMRAGSAGNVAVIGPAASSQPTYGGGGSAAVIPSSTVSPLQGLEASAGAGTNISYTPGLPADSSLPAIPATDLSPAYAPTSSGGSYTGTLTAPETGTYVLALDNPCDCYAPTYLSVNGRTVIANPGTPPASVYSASVKLVAGEKYALKIFGGKGSGGSAGGTSSSLTWATPSALAPQLDAAASAAKTASRAVVVVSDDTESEGVDRPNLSLPSAQDELISAVEKANPHTVVVVYAGAPVAMPWLSGAGAVLDGWYPGQTSGRSLAQLLFGQADPSGHLPVTFPVSLAQVPTSTRSRFPGVNDRVLYSEGIDVGYRWYDAHAIKPLFPFGFGLSYTHFAFRSLRVLRGPGVGRGIGLVHVSAVIKNVGTRPGSDVAQLYLSDPSASGEPPRQLVAFRRVSLAPGASRRVQFTVTPRDTWWWDSSSGGWSQSAGIYRVHVGDSSALPNLPLSGSFRIHSTAGARQVHIAAPATLSPGKVVLVHVRLSAGGTAVLPRVRFALQLPQGFSALPVGRVVFHSVAPGSAPVATFRIRPPAYAFAQRAVVHATATFGPDAQRETGMTVTTR
jgi:beta-glucosidase